MSSENQPGLVLLSGHGVDTWGDSTFGRDMRSAQDAVRGSALEWTNLRPSNFAQNGRSVTYRQITPDEYATILVRDGLDADAAHDVAEMFVLVARGPISGTSDGVADVLGRPPRPFEDYVVRTAVRGAWQV